MVGSGISGNVWAGNDGCSTTADGDGSGGREMGRGGINNVVVVVDVVVVVCGIVLDDTAGVGCVVVG